MEVFTDKPPFVMLMKMRLYPRAERLYHKTASTTFNANIRIKKPQQAKTFSAQKATKLDYEIGDTVRHIKFGVGIVTDIVDGGRDYEVTVNFDQAGTKKMFASFAKLKKL